MESNKRTHKATETVAFSEQSNRKQKGIDMLPSFAKDEDAPPETKDPIDPKIVNLERKIEALRCCMCLVLEHVASQAVPLCDIKKEHLSVIQMSNDARTLLDELKNWNEKKS